MESVFRSPLSASLASAQARTAAAQVLHPGRSATATVTAILDIGSYQVELEGRTLNLRLPMALTLGEQIRLQLDAGAEEPTLRVGREVPADQAALNRLLAQALPRQGNQQPALSSSLQAALRQPGELSPEATAQIRSLLALLPSATALGRADTLMQWFLNSGLMLERKLAQQTNPGHSRGNDARTPEPGATAADASTGRQTQLPSADLKLALLRLQQALNPPPASTATRTAATGARAGTTVPTAASAATPAPSRADSPATQQARPAVTAAPASGRPTPTPSNLTPSNLTPSNLTPAPVADRPNAPEPANKPGYRSAQTAPTLPGSAGTASAAPGRPALGADTAAQAPAATASSSPAAKSATPAGQQTPASTSSPTPAGASDAAAAEEPPLNRLRAQVDSSLANLQLHQARLLGSQSEASPHWMLDIPVADSGLGQQVRLSIRDQRRRPSHESGWSAELELSPAALGPVRVRLHLRGESLRTVIWAEDEQASQILAEALPLLDAALAATGLEVVPSRCYCGKAPGLAQEFDSGILDLRA